MKTVNAKCSYLTDGNMKSFEYKLSMNNFVSFKENVKTSAEFLARLHGGKISVDENEKMLYISYLDVHNTDLVDRMYLLCENNQ